MLNFRLKLSDTQRRELEGELVGARQAGDLLRLVLSDASRGEWE